MHRNTYLKYLYKAGYVTNNHIVRYVFNLDSEYGQGIPGHNHIDKDKIIEDHHMEQNQIIAEYYGYDESSSVTQPQLEQYYKHHPKSSDIM